MPMDFKFRNDDMQPVFATEIQNENRECKMIVDWNKEKRIISHTELWNGIELTFYIHRFDVAAVRMCAIYW